LEGRGKTVGVAAARCLIMVGMFRHAVLLAPAGVVTAASVQALAGERR